MAAAARAVERDERTIRNWLRGDEAYREAVREAIDEYAATAGQETHNALLAHVRAAVAGELVLVRQGVEGGKPVEVRERVTLNPALCKLLLTRADPRFTHPKQEVEHSGQVTLDGLLAAEAAEAADVGGGDDPA